MIIRSRFTFLGWVVSLLSVVFLFFCSCSLQSSSAVILFDNGTERKVTVLLAGKKVMELEPHSAGRHTVPVGEYELKVADDEGKVVDTASLKVPSAKGLVTPRWVYNIGGRNQYMLWELAYGKAETHAPKVIGSGTKFFQLPLGSTWFAPLESIPTKGTAGTTSKIVIHTPVHNGMPCCANTETLLRYIKNRTSQEHN